MSVRRSHRTYLSPSARTPRPWLNYLWNDHYLAIVAQNGQGTGLRQDREGFRTNQVSCRMVYMVDKDSGPFWTANAEPVDEPREAYPAASPATG